MDQQTARRKAQDLLNQMTIEEKIAQMTQISYAHCTREEALAWAERGVGSFLHVLFVHTPLCYRFKGKPKYDFLEVVTTPIQDRCCNRT